MLRSRRPARRRFAVALAALTLAAAPDAGAASLTSAVDYGTSGSIGSAGLSGPNVVRFDGMGQASAPTPTPYPAGQIPATIAADHGSSLDLGRFEVAAPAPGTATVYDHTPFAITVSLSSGAGGPPKSAQGSLVVRGWLDGTVGGPGPSQLMAHFQAAGSYGLPWEPRGDVGSFDAGVIRQTLTIPGFATALSVPGGGLGSTELVGVLVGDAPLPSPAPEPATVLIFVAAGAGLAVRARAEARTRAATV